MSERKKMEIDHVGFLVKNIKEAASAFRMLGFEQVSDIYEDFGVDGRRNVYLMFLENQNLRVEIVSPINEASDVYNILKRQGEGPYHICYRTDDIERTIRELKEGSWVLVKAPAPALAFQNALVAFLFKKGMGMIELRETPLDHGGPRRGGQGVYV